MAQHNERLLVELAGDAFGFFLERQVAGFELGAVALCARGGATVVVLNTEWAAKSASATGSAAVAAAAALLVALRLPTGFFLGCAACASLSVLYSVPPIRLKAIAGLDWLVNFLGFGFLVPYAGWALTGQRLTAPGGILLGAFAALFGALYPLTQLYHLEADRARGDRTLAVTLGITRTFRLALPMAAVALAGLALAGTLADWPRPTSRWMALGLAALGWIVSLWPWWKRRSTLDHRGHQRFMKRSFLAWAVTDLAVLWAFAR